jgi:hypothetical protein
LRSSGLIRRFSVLRGVVLFVLLAMVILWTCNTKLNYFSIRRSSKLEN